MSSSDTPSPAAGRVGRNTWLSWRQWRRSRPFAGPLLMILAGTELLAVLWSAESVRLSAGAALGGPIQLLLAVGLVLCGLLTSIQPVRRTAYSTAAVLLAICALLTPDMGGFLGATLLGAIGGSLGFAWVPADAADDPRPEGSVGQPEPALALAVADDGAAQGGGAALYCRLPARLAARPKIVVGSVPYQRKPTTILQASRGQEGCSWPLTLACSGLAARSASADRYPGSARRSAEPARSGPA
jgi:hypothetical protein